jgi:predicted Zn-ribbon and HTH transcriptional regulator
MHTHTTPALGPRWPHPCRTHRRRHHPTLHPRTHFLIPTCPAHSALTQPVTQSRSHSASHSVETTTRRLIHALHHTLPIQRPVQVKRRRNQRQVTERLRRVAQLLSRPGYLLRTYPHVVHKAKHVFEDINPLLQVLLVVRSRLYRVSVPYPTVSVSPTRVNASTSLPPALVPVSRPGLLPCLLTKTCTC